MIRDHPNAKAGTFWEDCSFNVECTDAENHRCTVLSKLRRDKKFADDSNVAGGTYFPVHIVILGNASEFFSNTCPGDFVVT